jgi:hypothetical protein
MYSGKSWDNYLPSISSYGAAKCKFNDIKPIRGRAEDVRPLGKRSADFINIHEVETSIMPAYAVRLYQTDIATYHADGRIVVKTGGWATSATTKALYRVLPTWDVRLVLRRVRVCGYVVTEDEGLTFVPSDPMITGGVPAWDGYTLLNPKREYVHAVNRKAANAVRKQYKHFNNWYKGYMSLREGRMTEGEMEVALGDLLKEKNLHLLRAPRFNNIKGDLQHAADMFAVRNELLDMALSGDYAQYQRAAGWLHCLHYTSVMHADGKRNWYGARHPDNVWKCGNAFTKWQELLLLLHAPDVLDVKPLPYTKASKDRFADWMRGWIHKTPTNRVPMVLPEDASLDKVK